jgi:hypothetical protein
MQKIIAYTIICVSFLFAIAYIVKSIVMIFSKKPAECGCCKNYTCRANQKKTKNLR